MGRGFTGGLLWGVMAAIFCLFLLIAYQSMKPEKSPDTISLEVPAGSAFNHTRDDKAVRSPKQITNANRAQVEKSELIEPSQGSGIDKTIGSSIKAPAADTNTLSSISSNSSTSSDLSIQRSVSLGEKPAFASRNMQRPTAPRAEGAVAVYSETPSSLPKEEIILEQKVETKLPTPELEVSIDPIEPNLAEANLNITGDSSLKSGDKSTSIDIPKDQTTGSSQFSELELQVSPQLPDADFSVMVNTDTASTLPESALLNPVAETNRDEVQNIDFSGLKDTDEHIGFATPDLSTAPQLPNAMQTPTQDISEPQLQQPAISLGETSQLKLPYSGADNNIIAPSFQSKVPNSFVPNDPQPLDASPVVQDADIQPRDLGQDVSADGFGSIQSNVTAPAENNNPPTPEDFDQSKEEVPNSTRNATGDDVSINPLKTIPVSENAPEAQSASPEASLSATDSTFEKSRLSTTTSEQNKTRPIETFAMPKVSDEAKPLLTVVLIADEKNPIDIQALKQVPFPISLAIPMTGLESEKLMNFYRSNGFEVAVIIDYPNAASVQEIDAILTSGLARLNKTVAVIEGSPGNLQKTRSRSEQTAKILSQTGHGLLVYDKGLNTIVREAENLGVPVRTIYRNFDELKGGSRTIRRFLDGAAFRARQEGLKSAIVVTASLHPETLNALLLWSMQSRSQTVTIAPLSQALMLEN
ncbi:MAG: hypothetical protein HOC45_00750 [Marinovum sp.]|nr:hypothetical protein [Marinovum sp.]